MDSSSRRAAPLDGPDTPVGAEYFDSRRALIDGFVARHFTWPGTLRLHGAALGWDILRAPFNVLLSPVLVLVRLTAHLCRRAGWRGAADRLLRRRILLRTAVARRVELLVLTELLGMSPEPGAAPRDPSAPARAASEAAGREGIDRRVADALGEYAGARSAIAEMTTTLCVLVIGAFAFGALTPGMISIAPDVAGVMARADAVASFPLGRTLGGMWHGAFGAEASAWLLGGTVAGLVMLSSVFAAFAGILADPVQTRLGIHRRRLRRLLDTLEVALVAGGDKPFAAREHYFARLLDLWDVVASAVRAFRP